MIAESRTQVEAACSQLQGSSGPEQHLVAASWANPTELARAADAFGLGLDDFQDRVCGVTVWFLRDCAADDRQPSWVEAEAHLRRFGVPAVDALYLTLIDTPTSNEDSIVDLVQQVQRAADDRTDEDCLFVTRRTAQLVLHALSCPHCQRCAEFGAEARRPAIARRGRARRKAVVVCG